MSDVRRFFSECISAYRASGAECIAGRLPELLAMLRANPEMTNNRAFLSEVLLDLKEYSKARDLLLETIQLGKQTDVTYNLLALAYWETNQKTLAYQAYEDSIKINAGNHSSLRGACCLAIELGKDAAAVEYCGRFHQMLPTGRDEILWFAIALWWSGTQPNKRRAIQLIDESDINLGLRPDFHEAIAG